MNRAAIILAAGAGTRMKSKTPKVAHKILGRELVKWVVCAARDAGLAARVCVLGHGADVVRPLVEGDCDVAIQPEQRGTADAVMCALASEALSDFEGSVVVLSGDCPLITPATIERFCAAREAAGAGCAVLTMQMDDPFGYGRIIRVQDNQAGGEGAAAEDAAGVSGAAGAAVVAGAASAEGDKGAASAEGATSPSASNIIARIVEQKDATPEQAAINECNSGFYCFDAAALRDALARVDSNNAQGEFYLTDVIELMAEKGIASIAVPASDNRECAGINNRVQLAQATADMRDRINREHMMAGVTMIDPTTVWIEPDVQIAADVTLLPNVALMGKTIIGEDSVIGPDSRLTDTVVGRGCTIDETVAIEAQIDDEATCGPRAYLRPLAHLCQGAKAGTHVEIKKSTIGAGSKVPHLSYIGDATIGTGVNIGAGSITCNYDGVHKHPTTIGDDVFVGSDTMMVAPVNIGEGAVIGAGSTITRDVPADALCVARARERVIDGWAKKGKE